MYCKLILRRIVFGVELVEHSAYPKSVSSEADAKEDANNGRNSQISPKGNDNGASAIEQQNDTDKSLKHQANRQVGSFHVSSFGPLLFFGIQDTILRRWRRSQSRKYLIRTSDGIPARHEATESIGRRPYVSTTLLLKSEATTLSS